MTVSSAGPTTPEARDPSGWARIPKASGGWKTAPNLVDYAHARATETWAHARRNLSGLPGGGLNIAYEAVVRHAEGPSRDRVALRCLRRDGGRTELSYGELDALSARFANALTSLGVRRGDLVCTLLGRMPELYAAVLGALRLGAVVSPLFSAFGPEPIRARLELGHARALVTTTSLYARKVAGIRDGLPELASVIAIDDGVAATPGTHDFAALLGKASTGHEVARTGPEDPALLHFTSGTTGTPKGALHVHEAVVAHAHTGRLALDLHPDDVFWCTADPGWVTGTSYGIVAPLVLGVTAVVDEGDFDAERWYAILSDESVSVWYTAPTAIRMMIRAGAELARQRAYPDLRFLASVGEPLNPEGVVFGQEAFGLPFHDNWWQTETGGIMIANYAALEIRPGSMGLPLPGVDAGIVRREEDGTVTELGPREQGELALRPGWPSMFRGYVNAPERYERCFAGGWYLTGDLAWRDEDGYVWFVGRADDVIKSSGHLIGPFEVESILLEHDAVVDVGVIGKPDPVAGEVVKAFVVLAPGREAGRELERELLAFARTRLGAAVAPKEIAFVGSVPKTRSGKVLRRLLKARELGLPEGDVSTLEGGS